MNIVAAVLAAVAAVSPAQPLHGPRLLDVSLDYSWLLDGACAEMRRRPVESEAIDELKSRLDEFRTAWSSNEEQLLKTTMDVTHHPIGFPEARAALVVCGMPSMSFPLVINMRLYLRTTNTGSPDSMDVFVDTLYHEILHRHVGAILAHYPHYQTPLLSKLSSEPMRVLNHLHLIAVEEEVYHRLGKDGELEEVKASSARLIGGADLLRARDIVHRESREAFLKELQSTP